VTTPQISVVLPVRNAAETIDSAVASTLASREVDLELVCVDDGSSDATPSRLEGWARRDRRCRMVRTPARGIVAALNTGIENARAPLVARMDADDETHPDRLVEQLSLLDERPDLALVGCRIESFREGGLAEGYRIYSDWVNGLVAPEEIEREAFVECPVPHPTWMFRRDAVMAVGGYRENDWPEDLDLLYRLLARRYRIGKVPRILYRWRDHPGRLSRRDPRYSREAFMRVKARYVGEIHPMRGAVVWGAGKTGRKLARLLRETGTSLRAFVDIRPERANTAWRGIPILAPDAVPRRASSWRAEAVRVLGAVSSRGARQEIRDYLKAAGLREGHDFLMLA
jgi:glycosyltransferase involved in cell wall biosynthesis